MMRWKPNRHSNYISYIGRQAREMLPRFQNVCDVRSRQGIAVGPSHAQHFEEKKKKRGRCNNQPNSGRAVPCVKPCLPAG